MLVVSTWGTSEGTIREPDSYRGQASERDIAISELLSQIDDLISGGGPCRN